MKVQSLGHKSVLRYFHFLGMLYEGYHMRFWNKWYLKLWDKKCLQGI